MSIASRDSYGNEWKIAVVFNWKKKSRLGGQSTFVYKSQARK